MSFLSASLAARAQQNLDALRNGDLLPAVASPNHHQRERRVDRGEFAFHTSSRSLDFGVRELRADAAAVASTRAAAVEPGPSGGRAGPTASVRRRLEPRAINVVLTVGVAAGAAGCAKRAYLMRVHRLYFNCVGGTL